MKSDHNQDKTYQIWKNTELSQNFLTGVRGAIPLATEQIDCLLRLIALTQPQVSTFLDLGCGDGILTQAIKGKYPTSHGVLVDISPTMLEAAQEKLHQEENLNFVLADFGEQKWLQAINHTMNFEVIVSGFAIHHLPNHRKQEIYQEIYDLLTPGGIFLNLEHIASLSPLGEQAFAQLFVDSLYAFHQNQGSSQSREEIDRQYYNRPDKTANILAPVEIQCQWLRKIGFIDIDCYLKILEIALFGGVKPQTDINYQL